MFVPLAYNIMHSPPPLHRPSWDQVQQKGEKEEIETKDKPFEPVSRPTSQVLQVGRNFGFEMVILHQDERQQIFLERSWSCRQRQLQQPNKANQMLEAYNAAGGKGSQAPRLGDGAKLLRAPEVFDTDDPVNYTDWRGQILNWLTFCDGRIATKLYSILSSCLQGPALQIVRAHGDQRNRFAVWHRLKQLYALRARPRALAMGQAIMQHPSFPQQRSMLENLLQFDALLDQYELAAGHRMPDDLTVSIVLRCLDGPTRRHLEMIMDEGMDYAKLKDKLILLDKNTKAWSGDNFLKNLQAFNQLTSSNSSNYQGPALWKWIRSSQRCCQHYGIYINKEGKYIFNDFTVFELRSDLEGDEQDEWYVRMVSDTSTLWFQLDSGENDHPGELRWSNDPLMDWYHGLLCTLDWRQGVHDEDENLYIRAVPAGQLVVLDSGVDISLLPYHLSGCGIPKSGGETILENAQGERLQAFGKRSARVECEGLSNDLVVIEDDFIVVSVQSALISIGRLLHRGWSLRPNSRAGAMVTLVSPDGEAEVPLEFKRNSMAVCASIQVVSARDASSTSTSTSASMARLPKQPKQVPEPKLGKIIEEENDMMAIQTVIIRKEELTRHILRRGLNTSSSGNPFIDLPQSKVGLLSS
ncbi:unnamed protein product [Cladocopium goreaui]|uniref:SAP domain-containing protein n=1 Tax=Cladocopium goreaui TaxID=2562237 RepID=A0A9P1D989_9DINO|nr:unnamed protein product [Cladocopium goreaui]